jgi:hypothetical protein
MAANIKIIRLINGEELLGELLPSTDAVCKIKNPVRIVVMPNKLDPKTPNVGFAPWAEFSDDKEFTIDKRHVLAIINPIKEFINQYNTMFGGLVVPTSNLILPGT